MDNNNCGFWPTDHLPDHQVNVETFRQLHNIWIYICTHFMILTSRNMKYELLRFFSLLTYPGSSQQDIRKLAIAGFYYFGDDDTVVCYCCGLRKRNWSPTDVPLDIHQRLASPCDFHHRNREVNIPFFTTADGGFRPLNEITILVNNRRMGPSIVQPAEYIQANLLNLANVRLHDEISLLDYDRYDNGLLPTANLPTTQSVNVNNEHGIANIENHVMGSNVVPHGARRMDSAHTFCFWGQESNTNVLQQRINTGEFYHNIKYKQYDSTLKNISSLVHQADKSVRISGTEIIEKTSAEKRPYVDDAAHVKCLEMKQVEASCHLENLQGVEESGEKSAYIEDRAQSFTNVKVYKDYDELAGLQQSNFPNNDVAKIEHNTGDISVKTGLKSDERNPKQYAFTEVSSCKESQHNSKKEQQTVDASRQIQPQIKAVNARNERGPETECSGTIDNQFSVRYNRATDTNLAYKELCNANTAPTDTSLPYMNFQTTKEHHFDKADRKKQSISDFESKFGNTQMDTGYYRGEAKMIITDKRISTKADMTGETQTNPPNMPSKGTARVRAFRNNSFCISNQLANGGFTYSDHEGFVQCGTCGIEFKVSDLRQDMWIKHAEASKNCRFVLQRKGHDFVQAVHEGQDETLQMYRDLFAVLEKNQGSDKIY